MKALTYRGFQASVEFDDGHLFVKVLHIDDLLLAEVDRASEAEPTFHLLVDEYIEDCEALGKEPTKPFSGTFNVRVGAELHRRAAMAAASDGATLNAWAKSAFEEKLECGQLRRRLDDIAHQNDQFLMKHVLPMRVRVGLAHLRHVEPTGNTVNLRSRRAQVIVDQCVVSQLSALRSARH